MRKSMFFLLVMWTLVSVKSATCSTEEPTDAILIMGYNNTRSNDVKKMRLIATEDLRAKTILCKPHPLAVDYEVADYVIDTSLAADPALIPGVIEFLSSHNLRAVRVLPFSDVGTQLGGILSEHLGLPGHKSGMIRGALDKFYFRSLEGAAIFKPAGYRHLMSRSINSLEELKTTLMDFGGSVFLKPRAEGNSRGCTAVESLEDCERAWEVVEKYIAGGIVAEELVTGALEFSCDSVNGISWLTQKQNASGKYRWESKYILPAPLDDFTTHKILEGGRFMAAICGSNEGAYHNEIFYKPETGELIAVEPNLRPAGGRIWDAAALAFRDFNPWKLWVNSVVKEGQSPHLIRDYYVGFKMLVSPTDGVIKDLPTSLDLTSDEYGELVWSKRIGDVVTAEPKDNSECIGYILLRHADPSYVDRRVDEIAGEIQSLVAVGLE